MRSRPCSPVRLARSLTMAPELTSPCHRFGGLSARAERVERPTWEMNAALSIGRVPCEEGLLVKHLAVHEKRDASLAARAHTFLACPATSCEPATLAARPVQHDRGWACPCHRFGECSPSHRCAGLSSRHPFANPSSRHAEPVEQPTWQPHAALSSSRIPCEEGLPVKHLSVHEGRDASLAARAHMFLVCPAMLREPATLAARPVQHDRGWGCRSHSLSHHSLQCLSTTTRSMYATI
jgi:hypothetical protein